MKQLYNYIVLCTCALLVACTDEGTPTGMTDPAAISFSTGIYAPATRVTTGSISNLDALKAVPEGFGVWGYLTDDLDYTTAFSTEAYNFFMQNQQVTWDRQWAERNSDGTIKTDGDGNEIWHRDWVYSPLKYWPNSTNNATPRRISFFAYAPYVAEPGATYGVTNFVRADDKTPHVIYKLGEPDEQVDLLWANCMNATRNGNGLIEVTTSGSPATTTLEYQKVPLTFRHALSAVDIYVQRVYDEPAYTGKIPDVVLYPTLYISKLELKSAAPVSGKNALQKSGKLSLIDGTWEDDGTWVGGKDVSAPDVTLTYPERMINDTIRGTTQTAEDYIRDVELDKWKWILDTHNTATTDDDEWVDATTITDEQLKAEPDRWRSAYGLSEDERHLFKDSYTQMFLPRKVTLVPTLTYSMVVRDDALEQNYLTDSEGHRYTRIVNTVTGNSTTLDLVAGKRYTLLIRVSPEHITFEVVSITDWDFPIRYKPVVVTGYEEENIGHILNEQ
ncbi:MAG: fimbrillin family protein [Bacteroidaceae bacterium]|nr:fimbrillin family protein [Bacteroidaceae bacterium]